MKVITITASALPSRLLVIGYVGENERTQVRIDCTAILTEYPHASPTLAIKPPVGAVYPVVVNREDNEVVWDVSNADLQNEGDGELQLTFVKDGVVAKTVIGKLRISRSLLVTGEQPDVIQTWYDAATEKLAEVDAQIVELEGMVDTATDAATRAEQSESNATTAAANAATSAATATAKATEATTAAGTATAKAAEAALSATQANNSAVSAADSERGAIAKAGEATTAAGTATAKAEQATEAAQTATEKAGDASASARAAHASEINAAESADDALSAEVGANAAKTAAETSATQAGISEQNAGTAAQTAMQKAAEATQSATNAATFAGTATTKAEEAAASAQAASDAQTAVEQTAEQLAESLEHIEQNTQDIAELDERKANVDGYYPDMTVGNAEQLNSSKYVENSEPYTLRTSGGSSDIGNREYLDAVVGGTLAWNQMVRDEASENQTDFAPIVTVTDAVEDAAGVKVKIEPVQDLHGYDHPWPAGGGKNKFDISALWESGTTIPTGTNASVRYYKVTGLSGSYTCSTNCPNNTTPTVASIFITNVYSAGPSSSASGVFLNTPRTLSASADGELWIYIRTESDDYLAWNAHTFAPYYIQLESGSSATNFAPYSNICPITGWDGVKVTRTGKNLFDNVWESGIISNKTGENMPGNEHVRCKNHIPCKNGQYIYMGWDITATGSVYMLVMVYGADGSFKRYAGARTAPFPLKLNDDEHFIRFYLYNRTEPLVNPYIVYGTTATDYEPYAGQVYGITLPTEAGTVYGGELTVNADGSGSLVVMSRYENVKANANAYYLYGGLDGKYAARNMGSGIRCALKASELLLAKNQEKFTHGYIDNPYTIGADNVAWVFDNTIRLPDFGCETQEEWVAYVQSQDVLGIVYPLLNSTTYTLTASQIRTLLGQNNVWADTGDLALTYTGTDEHLTLESGKKYLARISGTDSMLLGSGQEITAAKGTDNVFDLTQMFGAAVADYVYGQGAAFFRRWFPNAVYPYNAGELKHVEGLQSHDMVGFNAWDEEWENGSYSSTGQKVSTAAERIRSANKIRVLPSTTYYMTKGVNILCQYDSNGDFISFAQLGVDSASNVGHSVTMGENTHFITFASYAYYGTTYKHDICISLVHNGSRNGEYEPYEKHSYPLDSSVILRGIPKVGANGVYWDGDRYLPDGTVERRYGVVDLGTVQWLKNSYVDTAFNSGALTNLTPKGSNGTIANIVCNKYATAVTSGVAYLANNCAMIANSADLLVIRDDSFTDAAAFKAAMQGVYLVYELATPTTETAQPYHSTQWVSDWGTEEFVSTGIVPVGHETRYPANLRDKLQHLPDAASGNGSYLITQTDGQMVLTPFPAPPSSAGNYVLKATVVNGVATYTWEVAT